MELTDLGNRYVHATTTQRDLMPVKEILKCPVFNLSLKRYYDNDNTVDLEYIKFLLAKYTETLSINTISRRASTVKKWIIWLVENFG